MISNSFCFCFAITPCETQLSADDRSLLIHKTLELCVSRTLPNLSWYSTRHEMLKLVTQISAEIALRLNLQHPSSTMVIPCLSCFHQFEAMCPLFIREKQAQTYMQFWKRGGIIRRLRSSQSPIVSSQKAQIFSCSCCCFSLFFLPVQIPDDTIFTLVPCSLEEFGSSTISHLFRKRLITTPSNLICTTDLLLEIDLRLEQTFCEYHYAKINLVNPIQMHYAVSDVVLQQVAHV